MTNVQPVYNRISIESIDDENVAMNILKTTVEDPEAKMNALLEKLRSEAHEEEVNELIDDCIDLRDRNHELRRKLHLSRYGNFIFACFTLILVILFPLALNGVITSNGHLEEQLFASLPECKQPDGFVHSFEDLIKTMSSFTCPKGMDMLMTLYLQRAAVCFKQDVWVYTHNANFDRHVY